METKTNKATGEGETMTGYAIGETVWFYGDEYVILDKPFKYGGCGTYQNAQRASGKTIMVPTPEQKAANIARNQKEHADQQAGFSRLKELKS